MSKAGRKSKNLNKAPRLSKIPRLSKPLYKNKMFLLFGNLIFRWAIPPGIA